MEHIHLEECPSTQIFLKEKLESLDYFPENSILVSTSRQTQGLGRKNHKWIHLDNALAFSFTLKPHPKPNLTPLEIGASLVGYFQSLNQKLWPKWPNDLLNSQGQKCGGILCHFINAEIVIVGIGLNFGKVDSSQQNLSSTFPAGSIDEKRTLSKKDMEEFPKKIARYITENRISHQKVCETWNAQCPHLGREVTIIDGSQRIKGLFKGINAQGEAVLEIAKERKTIISGTLVY